MNILIKGMEMPEVCADCPFRSIPELSMLEPNRYHYISQCTRVSEEIEDPWRDTLWQLEHKESWCPLIEVPTPHGRLIDADALLGHMKKIHDKWKMEGHYTPTTDDEIMTMYMPTIIPEEEEKG